MSKYFDKGLMWMITNQVFDVIFISIWYQFEKVQLAQLVQLVLMKTIWKKMDYINRWILTYIYKQVTIK
jgi:hypothetical protein